MTHNKIRLKYKIIKIQNTTQQYNRI